MSSNCLMTAFHVMCLRTTLEIGQCFIISNHSSDAEDSPDIIGPSQCVLTSLNSQMLELPICF